MSLSRRLSPPRPTPFPYATLFRSQEPAGRERRLRERGHLARVAVDGRDTQDVAPDDGQLFGLLRPALRPGYHDHRSEEHTSELQSHHDLVCRLLLEKNKTSMPHTA